MESTFEIKLGDCLQSLKQMPDQSVHCCVTSPPYFGLRDYGTGTWVGGDPGCDHGVQRWEGPKQTQGAHSGKASKADRLNRTKCTCGATREDSQIGLEPTPGEFIQALVAVFREVRRVLRDDGTLWLNMGDSYAGSWGAQGRPQGDGQMSGRSVTAARQIQAHPTFASGTGTRGREMGMKPKDLMGIPWRLAFALQDDGWYLRQDIIWHKPNPMPESVRDRCTKAHEYVFLLSKSPRYYFDSEAMKEPAKRAGDIPGGKGHYIQHSAGGHNKDGLKACGTKPVAEKRNRRSVWSVSTKPYKGAHFATFPPELIEPCILAGCPVGGTVLDPFGGSGTTAGVAMAHDRNAVLCELNPQYAELVPDRIASILEGYGKKPKVKRKPRQPLDPQKELFDGAHC